MNLVILDLKSWHSVKEIEKKSRGICEKMGDFREFQKSVNSDTRDSKTPGIHTLEIPKVEDFVKKPGISRNLI